MAARILSICIGLLLVAQASAQCGQLRVNAAARILQGLPAFACSVPWHIHIHFVSSNDNIVNPSLDIGTMTCGGVLIDSQYVMVSPTCMFLNRPDLATIKSSMLLVAGDNDVTVFPETSYIGSQQEQFRRPSEIYFNDNYPYRSQSQLQDAVDFASQDFSAYRDNQCAVVKLETPFNLNQCVNTICLPEPGDNGCSFKNCIFSGNGISSFTNGAITKENRTQMTVLTALPDAACAILEREGFALPTAGGMCARAESTGIPCVNDDGGALACQRDGRYFLRGTGVPDFCSAQAPSLFADTSKCLDFINNVLAGTATPA